MTWGRSAYAMRCVRIMVRLGALAACSGCALVLGIDDGKPLPDSEGGDGSVVAVDASSGADARGGGNDGSTGGGDGSVGTGDGSVGTGDAGGCQTHPLATCGKQTCGQQLDVPPFTTIFVGALVGGLVAVVVAPDRVAAFAQARETSFGAIAQLKGVWLALAHGYQLETGVSLIDILVNRGGMESMLDTVWLVIAALAYGGVIEAIGAIERIITPIVTATKTAGALVASVVGAVFATNVATADQYMAGVLPARMFKQEFVNRGYAPTVMSRAIGDSATPTGALIPWNSCGAYLAATLGVATVHYLPYAIFNFVAPLLTIVFATFGIRMARMAVAGPVAKPSVADR